MVSSRICGSRPLPHLLPVVSKQAKLAGHFAAGKLTAIEVHTPGAAKGKRSSAGVWVQALACTRTTVGTEWRKEDKKKTNKAGKKLCHCKTKEEVLTLH